MLNKLVTPLVLFLALRAWPATYYVSTNGLSTNSGTSTNSPWPIAYAFLHIAAGDTVKAMPGTYTNQIIIRTDNTTFTTQAGKWSVKIKGWGATGNSISVWPPPRTGAIIDGLEVDHSPSEGIQLYASNSIIRNCWIHDSGAVAGVNIGSGVVFNRAYYSNIVENCLLENNGYSMGFDHGIYAAGTNCIFRNNVCRGNRGLGISLYMGDGGINGCQIYGNLIYSNAGRVDLGKAWQLGVNNVHATTIAVTNWVFGNTIIGTNQYLLFVQYGAVGYTNNILICPSGNAFDVGTSGTVFGDYNLAKQALLTAGAHDVISATYGFVNSGHGLYWITSASAGKGHALATVYGPVDFFGNTQSSVSDIGAFQYSPAYAGDMRVLDPSSIAGANYWIFPLILPSAPTNLRISKEL